MEQAETGLPRYASDRFNLRHLPLWRTNRLQGTPTPITIHPNLSISSEYPEIVAADIRKNLTTNRIKQYPSYHSLSANFIASPLGLPDKSDGTKRRIHHLSYPANNAESINSGIPEQYGTITYSTIHDAVTAVQSFGKEYLLVKRDFKSAFYHIPVSPLDTPLLGFHWNDTFHSEQFFPFGFCTVPSIFNLFAEIFH